MSDIDKALDTGNKLIDLIERVMSLATGNASFAKIGRHIKSQVNDISANFDDLARRYFDVLTTFRTSVDKAKSFDDIGFAIVELRREKYGLIFDRYKLAGRRRAFIDFITLNEDHRARSLMKFLSEYSSQCDKFFYCSEYNGIHSESWATALEELAKGYENYTGVEVNAMGDFKTAREMILRDTENALRQMAETQERLMSKATEIRELMRYRFW